MAKALILNKRFHVPVDALMSSPILAMILTKLFPSHGVTGLLQPVVSLAAGNVVIFGIQYHYTVRVYKGARAKN